MEAMVSKMMTGHEAIEAAAKTGARLSKYADPIEGARTGLTVDEAREIAREDPGLIYGEACRCGRITTEDEQHGTVRRADESGDGMAHDGGCDACCSCVAAQVANRAAVSQAAAAMGRAGRGASKVRGGSEHYRALAAKSGEARRANAHASGTCQCDQRPCKAGHVGADGGHCECGTMGAAAYSAL